MKLKELKAGESGTVVGFREGDPAYRQKLLRMGLNRSADFTVMRKAPLGGPIELEVRNSRVVLRSDEANVLEVEKR